MAPIRRYLRITKYSVLEVRIYQDDPLHSETWLLRRADPALPRIIEAVRPLVLPKLREENERSKGKGKGKSRGVKDVVVQGTSTPATDNDMLERSRRRRSGSLDTRFEIWEDMLMLYVGTRRL